MSTSLDAQQPIRPESNEEFKDLGFGTEVARGTRRRLLNRDGSFNVTLEGLNPVTSLGLYHWLLRISWPNFLLFIAVYYIGVNVVFAAAYLLCGTGALQTSTGTFANEPFYRAFFFSVDTLPRSDTATFIRLVSRRILWSRSKHCSTSLVLHW